MAETVRYDDLPGWEFVVEERSAGWFELSGQDEYGQSVSNEGSDVDAMLDEARRWAAQHLRDDRPWLA